MGAPVGRARRLFMLEKILGPSPNKPSVTQKALWLTPDQWKIWFEDALLAQDITFFYLCRPIGWRVQGDRVVMDVAGKFGRAQVMGKQLVDASYEGYLARRLPGTIDRYSMADVMPGSRMLELTHVDASVVPAGHSANPVDPKTMLAWHGDPDDASHYYIEHRVSYPLDFQQAEITARLLTRDLAQSLISAHPACLKARICSTSHEIKGPMRWRIRARRSGADEWIRVDNIQVPAGAFISEEGVWVASGGADVDNEVADALGTGWIPALQIGMAIGERLIRSSVVPSGGDMPMKRVVETDVVVVGGGTSGVSAAIAAGREGAKVLLIEMNSGLGGAGTLGGVNSYWFGQRKGFNREIAGRLAKQQKALGIEGTGDRWNVEVKMWSLLQTVQDAGVKTWLFTFLVSVMTDEGGRVRGATVATPEGLVEIPSKVVVDATGDGDAAVLAGADFIYGSDREGATMWYSLTPRSRSGTTRNNWTSTVDVGDVRDLTRAIVSGRRRFVGYDHASYLAPRESRHIIGRVRLTLTDQLSLKKWPDVVNVAFSNHDIKGHSTSDWIRMGLVPPNLEVEIPYAALIPHNLDGIIVVGKAISATHDALPAIRMQADLENLGFVAGVAAAMSVQTGTTLPQLPVARLQEHLVNLGMLPASILTRQVDDTPGPGILHWIQELRDDFALYEYSNMEFHDVQRAPIPIVEVCRYGPKVVPDLIQELSYPDSPRRLMVARALAWYGSPKAFPVLLEAIHQELRQGDRLPMRSQKIRYTVGTPDQGAMPDLCYLLHTVAWLRDERAIGLMEEVVSRMDPTAEVFEDPMSGLFHYVDAVVDIGARLGHPGCVPTLKKLHSYPLFFHQERTDMVQPDYIQERRAYLEIAMASALARCTALEGIQTLMRYRSDSRAMLRRYAYQSLNDITGLDWFTDPEAGGTWGDGHALLESVPLIEERGTS